ncbi:MAG: helix-turn-helix domain-containing protein [Pseudomonadota bacterium]
MNSGYLRIRSAAEYCSISERTLRTWLKEGLPHSKVKGVVLVKIENLDAFIEQFETRENQVDHVVDEVLYGL